MQPPDIEAYVLPRLEMRFETFEESKNFYNVYAKHAGFAVREGPKVAKESTFIARAMESMNRRCLKKIDSGTRQQPGLTAGLK